MNTHDVARKSAQLAQGKTLDALFALTCSYGAETAAIYLERGEEKHVTFDQYRAMTDAYAARLGALLPSGGYVALCMDTRWEWFPAFWGVMRSGHNALLVDASLPDDAVARLMREAGCQLILCDKPRETEPGVALVTLDELIAAPPAPGYAPVWGDSVALCTSGTTGQSRVFVYNGEAIVEQVLNSELLFRENRRLIRNENCRSLVFLPFHHVLGFVTNLLWCGFLGYANIYLHDRSPECILQTAQKCRPELLITVPLLANNLCAALQKKAAKQGRTRRATFAALQNVSLCVQRVAPGPGLALARTTLFRGVLKRALGPDLKCVILGGSHTPPENLRTLNALGYYTVCGFGMTETAVTSVETGMGLKGRLSGSVGKPLTSVEYRVKPGSDGRGEMLIRGRSMHTGRLVNGQLLPPDTVEDGWYPTGDLVRVDDRGRVYIEGRLKDVIINESGENVYPDELEDTLGGLDGVEQLCALGLKKADKRGYEDIALVVSVGGRWRDEDYLCALAQRIRECNRSLPAYKRLTRVLVTPDRLPLSNGIKVKRMALREGIESGQMAYRELPLRAGSAMAMRAAQGDAAGGMSTYAPTGKASGGMPTYAPNSKTSGGMPAYAPNGATADAPVGARNDASTEAHAAGAGSMPAGAFVGIPNGAPAASTSSGTLPPAPPRAALAARARALYAQALDIPVESVGDDSHFIDDLGGDSLQVLSIAIKAEELFGVTIPAEEYGRCATVNGLCEVLEEKLSPAAPKPAGAPAPGAPARPVTRFEDAPEYQAFAKRQAALMASGSDNPYFVCHDSPLRDKSLMAGQEVLNFGSYNYVGMSGRPEVNRAAIEAIERYGTSASGSRLLAGEKSLHQELERELADWKHAESALVCVGGHSTNVTFVGNFCGERDLIVYDALAHNSIAQGCQLSRATSRPFPHNDAVALESILKARRNQYEKVLIVIEGAYSMDGDIADVPAFVRLKKQYGCFLMVDEAHSACVIGKTGGGVDEYFGLLPNDVDIKMGTLSKGLGTCGGYLAGRKCLIEYLRYNLPGFVFSVGISPALAAGTLCAIRLLRNEPEIMDNLRRNIACFASGAKKRGLDICLAGETAVIPVLVGRDEHAFALSNELRRRGVFVPPAVYPAVPKNKARLRFCVISEHRPEQIDFALNALEEAASALGVQLPRREYARA